MMQKASGSPDYRTMPIEEAMADLQIRITNYEKVYEPITDDSMSYIKLINLQSKVICNKIFGSIAQSTATFLMALNISERAIYLTRSGQVDGLEDFNKIKVRSASGDAMAPSGNSTAPPSVASMQKQLSTMSMLTRAHTSPGEPSCVA